MNKITSTERKNMIRLAAALPAGSPERRDLLRVLASSRVRVSEPFGARDFDPRKMRELLEGLAGRAPFAAVNRLVDRVKKYLESVYPEYEVSSFPGEWERFARRLEEMVHQEFGATFYTSVSSAEEWVSLTVKERGR